MPPRRAPYWMEPQLAVLVFFAARQPARWFAFRGKWFVGRSAPAWLQGG